MPQPGVGDDGAGMDAAESDGTPTADGERTAALILKNINLAPQPSRPTSGGGDEELSTKAPSGEAPVFRRASQGSVDGSEGKASSSYLSNRSTAPGDPANAWFAGTMRRHKCEEAVCASIHGAFLVRQSSGDKANFVVCVNDHGKPMHFQVQGKSDATFSFAGNGFENLQSVVTFLRSQTLHGKSGNLLRLTAPAPAGKHYTPPPSVEPLRRQPSTAAAAVARFAAQRAAAAAAAANLGAIPRSPSDGGPAEEQPETQQLRQQDPQHRGGAPSSRPQHQPALPPVDSVVSPIPQFAPSRKPRRRSLSVGHDPRHESPAAKSQPEGRPSWMISLNSDPLNDSNNSGYGNEESGQFAASQDSIQSFMNDEELGDLRQVNDGVGQLHTALSLSPRERNSSDHARIATEMLSFHLFAAMSEMLRLRLCQLLEHADYEKNTALVPEGESADVNSWWWVVISGEVVVQFGPESGRADMIIREGNDFGIGKNSDLFSGGTFVAGKDGCQTVKVGKADYDRLHSDDVKDTRHFMHEGKSVLVTERQQLPSGEQCPVIVEGEPTLLINALLDQEKYDVFGDASYTDVFLMAFRTFTDADELGARLLDAAADPLRTARVVAIATAWASQHAQEFLVSPDLVQLLYRIEVVATSTVLQCNLGDPVKDGIAKLRKCRKAGSVERTVIIQRVSGTELGLKIRGGTKTLRDIFVAKIFEPSCAADAGLLIGDRILSCNGIDFRSGMTHRGAVAAIKAAPARCSISVVYDPTSMMLPSQVVQPSPPPPALEVTDDDSSSMLSATTLSPPRMRMADGPTSSPARGQQQWPVDDSPIDIRRSATISGGLPGKRGSKTLASDAAGPVGRTRSGSGDGAADLDDGGHGGGGGGGTNWGKVKMGIFSRGRSQSLHGGRSQSLSAGSGVKKPSKFKRLLSRTNSENSTVMKPKLDRIQSEFNGAAFSGLRVHRGSDHGSRFVAVEPSSTASDVVALLTAAWKLSAPHSLYVFMITGSSNGPMAFSKVLDDQTHLGTYLDATGRYYLVEDFAEADVNFSNDARRDFESSYSINSLIDVNPRDIARFLTMRDANLFAKIPPLEYVTYLWTKSAEKDEKCPNIAEMTNWFNHVRNWVIYEVLSEKVIKVRVEVLRRLIKVARACLTVKNLNGLFAVISGLSATPVSRQKATWEKLSKRYTELYAELEQLMDPSRNMSRYRYLLASSQEAAPWIPFFPMLMKDIDFLHEGNKSKTEEGLVNFEKCRMLSRIIMQHNGAQLVPYNAACMFPKKETKPKDPKSAWLRAQISRSIEVRILRSAIPADDEAQMDMSFECEPSRRKRGSSMSGVSRSAGLARLAFPASKTLEDTDIGASSSTDADGANDDPRSRFTRSSSAPVNLGDAPIGLAKVPSNETLVHGTGGIGGGGGSGPGSAGRPRRASNNSPPMGLVTEEGEAGDGGACADVDVAQSTTPTATAASPEMSFENFEAALGKMRERDDSLTRNRDVQEGEPAAEMLGPGGQFLVDSPPPSREESLERPQGLGMRHGSNSNSSLDADVLQTPIPLARHRPQDGGGSYGAGTTSGHGGYGIDGSADVPSSAYMSPSPRPTPRPRAVHRGSHDPLATPLNAPLPPDPTHSATASPDLSPTRLQMRNGSRATRQSSGSDEDDDLGGFERVGIQVPRPPSIFADDSGDYTDA